MSWWRWRGGLGGFGFRLGDGDGFQVVVFQCVDLVLAAEVLADAGGGLVAHLLEECGVGQQAADGVCE